VDFLGELVDGGVGGRADEDGTAVETDELVNDGGAGDGLAGS
jgi:hypothetical protein